MINQVYTNSKYWSEIEDIILLSAFGELKEPKVDNFEYGEVYYCNCMDLDFGLPSLETKSFDLGYIDYVWESDMKENTRDYVKGRQLDNSGKTFFDDSVRADPLQFRLEWFYEVKRVCERILLVIPEAHKKFWYRNTNPTGDIQVLWKNGFSGSKYAKKSRKSSYMLYGKFSKNQKFAYDYLAKRYNSRKNSLIEPYTLEWGFCSKEKHFKHPSPKGTKIALDVLKQLEPTSLLDPFAGSGSYLKAASILGIEFLGYEINEEYKSDIDDRFSLKTINNWM